MRAPHRLSAPFLIAMGLALLAGCRSDPPSATLAPPGGGDPPPGDVPPASGEPRNYETGAPLEFFTVPDSGVIWIDEGSTLQLPDSTAQVSRLGPGLGRLLRSQVGEVDLYFAPGSMTAQADVALGVGYGGGRVMFELGPDGTKFARAAPVRMRFFPHVLDPTRSKSWEAYTLYWEIEPGWFVPLPTLHSLEPWSDPQTGAVSIEYCLTAYLTHFSKYSALR